MELYSFDAVIFDLDGVITKTALVHAQAWKSIFDEYLRLREKRNHEPFREFTHNVDYLTYVDGKPRYEGVRSFLESRGIQIPSGQPSDRADKETVCGIGNKKNAEFLELLKKKGIEVYPSTIQFIKDLRKAGIRIGAISSSKSCRYILRSAGIENLFQTRVDGEVSLRLGLKGKPARDVFVTAAHNLGTVPARSVAVEDAISGVQAARNGGFGLVIGLARKNNQSGLIKNGADMVLSDISEINLEDVERWFHRRPKPLFQFWDKVKSAFLFEKRPVFFLDYDGTLTPIVDRPELAVISQEMREVLARLSKKYTIAIISGRMREDVERLVGIKGILYAGSHGFDILGPGISMVQPRAKKTVSLIAKIAKQLSKELGAIPGILFEEKKFSVAVHYRLVDERHLSGIKDSIDKIIRGSRLLRSPAVAQDKTLNRNGGFRLMSGKKVFEILPRIDWDKGKAVRWIMQALGLSWSDASVVYIGDDTTDEDAFRIVRVRGVGILVCDKPKESAADFQLSSTEEVKRLFEEIIK
jgi:alpha,alpha-trehalase